MNVKIGIGFIAIVAAFCAGAISEPPQQVEGFDQVTFHYPSINDGKPLRDFRGDAPGYMTAPWWMPGLKGKPNYVSWKTAVVPERQPTTFEFIGSSSVLPPQFARGPSARLLIDGREALTFTIGANRDFIWKQGDFELKYVSKRVEFPYSGSHRELRELNGNSGIYELSVPADAVEAGKPAEIKVELLPFEGWDNGWFMIKARRDVLKPSIDGLQGQIDALQQDMARSNELTQILATQLYSNLLSSTQFEHEVIYQNGFRHVHPADLIHLDNGDILLMFREGTEHISIDGDVIMLRSSDNGKTWGDRQIIAGIQNLDEREGCGVQLHGGTIVVGIFYNNLYNTEGTYGSRAGGPHPHPELNALGTYIITSNDEGHTWSKPNYIDTAGMPFKNVEGPTDAPIELPDGTLLMGVIGYGIDHDPKNTGSVMLRSTDKGQTWSYLSTIAGDPGGKLGGLVEPGIVRTKTGRIVAALRNEGPDRAVYTTFSDDDGKTWAPVQKTKMYGGPTDLLELADGRVMATYGVRPWHNMPCGIRACFSSDNGQSFDLKTEVQIRNDFVNFDIGYPESMQLADGRIFTVYYYTLFDRYFIGGSYWKPQ
jgi:hypothetical protein